MASENFFSGREKQYKELLQIPSNRYVQLLRERNERDHLRDDLYFDHKAANRAVNFFALLRHSKGKFANKPFILAPWQEFDLIRLAYGWKWKKDGRRRFNTIYVEVAKKNGKSALGSGNGIYLFIADREPGADVVSAATKLDQARTIHDEAKKMLRKSRELMKFVDIYKNTMTCPSLGSRYTIISGNADGEDGVNTHGANCDELHRWKEGAGRDLWAVIEEGSATRDNPMIWGYTTAGAGSKGFCWTMRDYGIKVLEGIIEDDTLLPYIATLDEDDDPFDPEVWYKPNPSLDIAVTRWHLERAAKKAKSSPIEMNKYLRFRMNRWTEAEVIWFPPERWKSCATHIPDEELIGVPCWGGLDLATTIDITAFVLIFPFDDGRVAVRPWFWIPEENMQERWKRDKVPYPLWVEQGHIEATPGASIDQMIVRERINEICDQFNVQEIAFDPHNAVAVVQGLMQDGLEMVQHRQGFISMNPSCKQLEALVYSKRLCHGDHPVLNWMASHVVIKEDAAGNIKTDKKASNERIDGIVALAMGVGKSIIFTDEEDAYQDRGLIVL